MRAAAVAAVDPSVTVVVESMLKVVDVPDRPKTVIDVVLAAVTVPATPVEAPLSWDHDE